MSVFRPFYGFLIYVCFSLIRPESLWHWSVPAGNYSRIIAISFLVGWAIHGFGNKKLGAARRPAVALACYFGWALVSTLFCEFPDSGIIFLENSAKIIIPLLAGLTLINTRKQIYQLAWVITASIGYVAYDLNMAYFSGFNRLEFEGFGGMDNNSMTIGLVTAVGFAFFLGLAESIWWRKYLAFAFAAYSTHAVFFSFSRGGMLGLCVVGVVTVILIPKNTKSIGLIALGAVVAFAMAGPEVWNRFNSISKSSLTGTVSSEAESSAESRVVLWGVCMQMVLENPLVGKGPDHFPKIVHRYETGNEIFPRFPEGKEAHTLWFQIAAELGIPGVAFLASYYILTVATLWRYSRLDNSDSQGLTPGATARMVIAAVVGFMVSAQFVSLEGLELPYYVALVGLGTLKVSSTVDIDFDQRGFNDNGFQVKSEDPQEYAAI